MSKHLINENGIISKCNAKKRNCPLGRSFDSIDEAEFFLNEQESNGHSKDYKKKQLLKKKDKLFNQLKDLKGIKKLKEKKN